MAINAWQPPITTTQNPKDWLTPRQYADQLGLTEQAIYKRIRTGSLKAEIIAGRKFINPKNA